MSKYRNIRHMLITVVAALALTVPAVASATTIGLSGTLDNVVGFGPTSIAAGDSVTGSFDVALQADNSFAIEDLNFFDLAVGSNQFNLISSDFTNFSGAVSSDVSTVTALNFLTSGFPQSTAGNSFNLAFDIDNPPFTITGFGPIGTGTVVANVAGGNGVAAVPEPRESVVFGFALALMGIGMMARRRRHG